MFFFRLSYGLLYCARVLKLFSSHMAIEFNQNSSQIERTKKEKQSAKGTFARIVTNCVCANYRHNSEHTYMSVSTNVYTALNELARDHMFHLYFFKVVSTRCLSYSLLLLLAYKSQVSMSHRNEANKFDGIAQDQCQH